jgi:hypothetical protein
MSRVGRLHGLEVCWFQQNMCQCARITLGLRANDIFGEKPLLSSWPETSQIEPGVIDALVSIKLT